MMLKLIKLFNHEIWKCCVKCKSFFDLRDSYFCPYCKHNHESK